MSSDQHALLSLLCFTIETAHEALALSAEIEEEVLRVADDQQTMWVEFAVVTKDAYTVLTISDWQGIADVRGALLRVDVSAESTVHMTELDYMGTFREKEGQRSIVWQSPAQHFGVNPSGSFALFRADSDEEYDEIMLRIWVNENQPHPDVSFEWNLESARRWLKEWQDTFSKRSQMVVNGESLDELYELVPFAEKAGIDEIYLFTPTWRPDAFWPMTDLNWALNKTVFPNGRADLKAYSDHLAEKGIRLAIHYVSGGFGPHDPKYVGSSPHTDLAAWGYADLKQAIDAEEISFIVTPDDQLTWPMDKRAHMNQAIVQVGGELVRPNDVSVNADGTWTLIDCERGMYDTKAASHEANAKMKFLVMPYASNFIPDNNSDLLYEVADNFASLLNECGIAHAEFDGAEIHSYNGQYGYIKFAQRIYEKMRHGISGHDSSGGAPRCFFEYRFKSSAKALRGACRFTHGNWLISMQVDSDTRPASGILDAHFFLSQGHWGGAMGISKPEPMFGVTTEMLAKHGLTNKYLDILSDWKEAAERLTEAQHEMIEASLVTPKPLMPEASTHRVSDTVYRVARHGGDLQLVPVQVMKRRSGDIQWVLGQEFGSIGPRQFIQPGDSLELINVFEKQTPGFVIRVLPAFDRDQEAVPFVRLQKDENEAFEDKDFFVAGNAPDAQGTHGAVRGNVNILPDDYDNTLSEVNNTPDAVYHVSDLPVYDFPVDLSGRRGIGLEIEGDGSGALVLVQLEGRGKRDHVIPVDFTGRRYVEIPNGEVAWARDDWGWRMKVKTMDYRRITDCRIGLGMVPANTSASVKILSATALAEHSIPLVNPAVRMNDAVIQFDGEVESGNHLVYEGGSEADLVDQNWNFIRKLPVVAGDLSADAGANSVTIEAAGEGLKPWLNVQFTVTDRTIALK